MELRLEVTESAYAMLDALAGLGILGTTPEAVAQHFISSKLWEEMAAGHVRIQREEEQGNRCPKCASPKLELQPAVMGQIGDKYRCQDCGTEFP